jgi:hypothetical protein
LEGIKMIHVFVVVVVVDACLTIRFDWGGLVITLLSSSLWLWLWLLKSHKQHNRYSGRSRLCSHVLWDTSSYDTSAREW